MLLKVQQSNLRLKNLVAFKYVGVPLVAFASCVAGIGGILSATGAAQVSLGAIGILAAVAAFFLSFLDSVIDWQLRRTTKRMAHADKASTRFEGAV